MSHKMEAQSAVQARSTGGVGRWISTILIALVTYNVVQRLRAYWRLRNFKGPLLASLSRIWLVRTIVGGELHLVFQDVNAKYGSVARIGPNDLVTSDPDLMKRMLAVRSPYLRSEWYIGMRIHPDRDNVDSTRDDARHTQLRSIMAAGYSGKENEDLEGTVNRNIQSFINLIKSKYLSTDAESKPLDFGRKVQYFTLDTIADIAYRKPFGYMAADTDLFEYIEVVEKVFASALMVTIFPWLNWVFRLSIVKAALPSEKDPLGLGKILGITGSEVATRYGPNKKIQRDMLGSFVAHGLTQEEAESETMLQIVAGTDTTATVIRSTMLYLLTHPRVITKILEESAPYPSPIPDATARNLPYLQAVIKEGLRIFPPVVGLMSKEVPAAGDVINGIFVPGGTKIGFGAYGIYRNKSIWGEDVESFRPERWLDVSPEQLKTMESALELIFSYGKYKCLGKDIAMMELNKIFIELLRAFDFSIINPLKPMKTICHGIFFQSEFWLTARERK